MFSFESRIQRLRASIKDRNGDLINDTEQIENAGDKNDVYESQMQTQDLISYFEFSSCTHLSRAVSKSEDVSDSLGRLYFVASDSDIHGDVIGGWRPDVVDLFRSFNEQAEKNDYSYRETYLVSNSISSLLMLPKPFVGDQQDLLSLSISERVLDNISSEMLVTMQPDEVTDKLSEAFGEEFSISGFRKKKSPEAIMKMIEKRRFYTEFIPGLCVKGYLFGESQEERGKAIYLGYHISGFQTGEDIRMRMDQNFDPAPGVFSSEREVLSTYVFVDQVMNPQLRNVFGVSAS